MSHIVFEDDLLEFEDKNSLGIRLLKGMKLYKHQEDCIEWMLIKEREKTHGVCGGILALHMGMGKTLSITSLCMTEEHTPAVFNSKDGIYRPLQQIENSHMFPNLVVCSKTVSNEWKRDINKFFGDSCPFLYLHKDEYREFDSLSYSKIKNYKIIITTYETIMSVNKKCYLSENQFSLDYLGRKTGINKRGRPLDRHINTSRGGMIFFNIPWNRVVLDESHRISNPKTSTFYSMMTIYGDKKWCLSGTPLRNYSSDIFSQLRFCGYTNVINHREFNFLTYEKDKLSEFIYHRTYSDSDIYLPDVEEKVLNIELENEEKEIYKYYLGETKKIYSDFLCGLINFSCVLTLFLRLRQLCVSPYIVLNDDKCNSSLSDEILDNINDGLSLWIKNKDGTSGINSSKIKKTIEIIKSINKGEKILIFTSFKKAIKLIQIAIDNYCSDRKYLCLDGDVKGKDRESVLENFKKGKEYDILFIIYKVGSEGLNLTEATNIIMIENWWTPVVQQQAIARAHRIGQEKKVKVWKIICKDSIEERIEEICKDKTMLISDFVTSKKRVSSLNASTIGRIIR